MGRKEEAKIAYERLKKELDDEATKIEIENVRKHLKSTIGWQASWEDAVLYLAEKREEEKKMEETTRSKLPYIKHKGKHLRVYYYPIENFEPDLPKLGSFLEELEDRSERILATVPNIGFVPASIVLGTSFQGVEGFAIVSKKAEGG